MNTLHKIEILRQQLDAQASFNFRSSGERIEALLAEIIDDMSGLSYQETGECRLALFDVFDQHQTLSLELLLLLAHRSISLIAELPVRELNSIPTYEDDVVPGIRRTWEYIQAHTPPGTAFCFSSHPLPHAQIPEDIRQLLLLHLPSLIERTGNGSRWVTDDLEPILILLALARQIAFRSDQLEHVYELSLMVIERLNISTLSQLARDFTEDILIASIADMKREWGYLVMSKAYIGQQNVLNGLLYLNISTGIALKNSTISTLLLKNLLFVVLTICRDLAIPEWIGPQFSDMLYRLRLNRMDLLYIKSLHMDNFIFTKDPSAIVRFYDHLNENREDILHAGTSYIVPALFRIYKLGSLFPGHPDLRLLAPYEDLLEMATSLSDYQSMKAITLGQTENLDEVYFDILTNLGQTRSSLDIPYDAHIGIVAAGQLIKHAYSSQDINRFTRAAILKSDYSLSFRSQPSFEPGTAIPFTHYSTVPSQPTTANYNEYSNYLRSESLLDESTCVLWLLESERTIYYATMNSIGYSRIYKCAEWTIDIMRSWLDRQFDVMDFENEQRNQNSVLPYSRNDQLISLDEISSQLKFAKVTIPKCSILLVVKDFIVSGFPHNLLLGEDGAFALMQHAIAGILSMEWYLSNLSRFENLACPPTIHCWIPIQSSDMALNILWSQLEPLIATRIDYLDLEVTPKRPLSGDINIICAHGSDDIATFHALFMDQNTATTDVDKIIGLGSILILFVCHSGSMTHGMLKHQVQSMARHYLNRGYQAIIAPYWALDISIPPIWLPHFIHAFDSGATVADAAFEACQCVYNENAHPGAWACLHLYGNPELKIIEDQ